MLHLNIHDWLAASVEHADVPDTVYLVLADSEGKRFFIDTKRTQRPDVRAHFNKISLASTGYASVADVSSLKGHYSLEFGVLKGRRTLFMPSI